MVAQRKNKATAKNGAKLDPRGKKKQQNDDDDDDEDESAQEEGAQRKIWGLFFID